MCVRTRACVCLNVGQPKATKQLVVLGVPEEIAKNPKSKSKIKKGKKKKNGPQEDDAAKIQRRGREVQGDWAGDDCGANPGQ